MNANTEGPQATDESTEVATIIVSSALRPLRVAPTVVMRSAIVLVWIVFASLIAILATGAFALPEDLAAYELEVNASGDWWGVVLVSLLIAYLVVSVQLFRLRLWSRIPFAILVSLGSLSDLKLTASIGHPVVGVLESIWSALEGAIIALSFFGAVRWTIITKMPSREVSSDEVNQPEIQVESHKHRAEAAQGVPALAARTSSKTVKPALLIPSLKIGNGSLRCVSCASTNIGLAPPNSVMPRCYMCFSCQKEMNTVTSMAASVLVCLLGLLLLLVAAYGYFRNDLTDVSSQANSRRTAVIAAILGASCLSFGIAHVGRPLLIK